MISITNKLLNELSDKALFAEENLEQAERDLVEARRHLDELTYFQQNTEMVSTDINIINNESVGNVCTVMTAFYKLHGQTMLFTVTEIYNGDYENYLGTIIDYTEKTVLFACQFYQEFDEKTELFDRLVAEYAKWRFDL